MKQWTIDLFSSLIFFPHLFFPQSKDKLKGIFEQELSYLYSEADSVLRI